MLFMPQLFSYRFLPNFKKLCDSNKSRIIFQRKDSPQLHRFQFLRINSLMAENIKFFFFQNEIFINKLLNLIIIYSFSKIGNVQVVENLLLGNVIHNLLELALIYSNQPFNNNVAILESKIIYFCLRSNFRGSTTLRGLGSQTNPIFKV